MDIKMSDVHDLDIVMHSRDGYAFAHMNFDGKPHILLNDQEERFGSTKEIREMHLLLE